MSLKPGQIQFHQWCEPPLAPGDYKVRVTQDVTELAAEGQKSRQFGNTETPFSFSVAGPRFSLNPSEIYCVYPPKGHIGDFANSLPHVVFTRRTLPWERNLHPGADPAADRSWMAILLFSAADFSDNKFPDIKGRSVGDLLAPRDDSEDKKPVAVVGPKLTSGDLADYESEDDLCNTIDLPGELFQQIAPRLTDIQFLGHVREVDTGDKETLSFLADGWFSVVLGNRFPQPEEAGSDPSLAVENRAILVSLEGMEDYLPGGSESLEGKKIRLAVLANWSFHCRKSYSFKFSMDHLKAEGFKLPLPKEFLDQESESGAPRNNLNADEQYVSDGFNRGYVALNHETRLGEKTVSWYRGPLTPVDIQKKDYVFKPVPDGLLRYDYHNGLMDATYAAAAQLGRLLALQDRTFAKALSAYRSKVNSQVKERYRKETLLRALNARAVSKEAGEDETSESQILEFGLSSALSNNGSKKTGGQEKPKKEKTEKELFEEGWKKDDIQRTPPKAVRQWLARLILLYRVPFSYLVPDERLLPPDSLRFFCLDPGWIKCLLEGACSVGRSSIEEQEVDEFLRNRFLEFALEDFTSVRQKPESEDGALENAGGPPEKTDSKINWPLTGFLLRSPLVAGWQGVEMRAWKSWDGKTGERLSPLRIDRLSPDIMLCLFNGPVVRIEVMQPPEGMHFGAAPAPDGDNYVKTTLRRMNPEDQAGDQVRLKEGKNIPVPLRRSGPAKRVVEVAELAKSLEEFLKLERESLYDMDEKGNLVEPATKVSAMNPHEMDSDGKLVEPLTESKFTSAEMGVQMTDSPGRVWIEIPIREKVPGLFQGYPVQQGGTP